MIDVAGHEGRRRAERPQRHATNGAVVSTRIGTANNVYLSTDRNPAWQSRAVIGLDHRNGMPSRSGAIAGTIVHVPRAEIRQHARIHSPKPDIYTGSRTAGQIELGKINATGAAVPSTKTSPRRS